MNDLWEELQRETKPILLYGMGNGAEKLLAACRSKGVKVAGVFCSDGFERGKSFCGMPVIPYGEAKAKYREFMALLAFGTSRDEVLALIRRVGKEQTLRIPDLPVAGEALFDGRFYEENREKFDKAPALLADEQSREVFDAAIAAKLYGRLEDFERGLSTLDEDFERILHPQNYRQAADLGAYDGDSAKFLLGKCPEIEKIVALEPDGKTFARLLRKTEGLPVVCKNAAAWDQNETLAFSQSGNRGAGIGAQNGAAGGKTVAVQGVRCDDLLRGTRVDFIKFDVEGAEKKALDGLRETIARDKPEMLVSCYHRAEDLYDLPLYIHENYPFYKLYLRRQKGLPAWDVNLYCVR